jgi:hypothetical protein
MEQVERIEFNNFDRKKFLRKVLTEEFGWPWNTLEVVEWLLYGVFSIAIAIILTLFMDHDTVKHDSQKLSLLNVIRIAIGLLRFIVCLCLNLSPGLG